MTETSGNGPPSDHRTADGVARLEPVVREPTASVIARRIRGAIIEGSLAPGTQLTEMRLARQLGVSRAPIREALQRLIQEGLAENRRRGVFVKELTLEDVIDIYFARASCELAATNRILDDPADVDWKTFERILEDLEVAARAGNWEATADVDRRFHQALVDAARSPRLARMFATLMAETAMCLQALERSYENMGGQLVDEHREIFEALHAGDRKAAAAAIATHMHEAVERLAAGYSPDAAP